MGLENIPYWSDIGGGVGKETRDDWSYHLNQLMLYEEYYSGDIFNKEVEDAEADDDKPLLYPLGVNISKMLCLAMADAAFGEWKESIINFEPNQEAEVTEDVLESIKLMKHILRASRANSSIWEMELDRNKFGGGILKVAPGYRAPNYVVWNRIPAMEFFPVVDPEDEYKFLQVKVVAKISKEQAALKYGYDGDSDSVKCEEIWDLNKYEFKVADKRIDTFSGVNPYGVVPFVYIPRFRSSDWYGESLINDVYRSQDELNRRLADLGEAINYNAHPTRVGKNLPRRFNAKNFPLGRNALWDLGRAFAGGPQPEVEMLEAKNPIPQGTFDFIKWIYDWSRTSVFAPPIAFGEDNGGGQRSGITLEIRMMPLLKAMRRSRAYMISGLEQAMDITARILEQKKVVSPGVVKVLREKEVVPSFTSIMPRDQAAVVDEVVKRLSTNPPTISLTSALKLLGSSVSEEDDIKKMMDEIAKRNAEHSDVGNNSPNQGNVNE